MRIIFAIREISRKLSKDNITGYAAQSCFFLVLSFFPFILLLLSLIRYLPVSYDTFMRALENVTPAQLHPLLDGIISDIFQRSTSTLTLATVIGTLWASSKGFMSIIRGFNSVYQIEEKRSWLFQRLVSTLYTLIFLIVILTCLVLVVFGNKLIESTAVYLPYISKLLFSILEKKFIFIPGILLLLFMFMYKMIPNRKSTLIRELPGAAIAAAGWYLFSYFYSLYVNCSPGYSYMYGSLTTFVFALVWLYSCMIILLFGAEFNTFIEQQIISRHIFKRRKRQ